MTDETRPDEAATPNPETPPPKPPPRQAPPRPPPRKKASPSSSTRRSRSRTSAPARSTSRSPSIARTSTTASARSSASWWPTPTCPASGPARRRARSSNAASSKEVGDQVKTEVLLASLEQLAEDHDIAPLSHPDIDPADIEMPHQGPLVYEFEVEVRPQFDLPNYKGLKLKRLGPHLHRRGRGPGGAPPAGPARPGRAQAGRQRPDRRHPHRRRDHARRRPRRQHHQGGPVPHRQASWPSRTASPRSFAEQVQGANAGDTQRRGHRAVHGRGRRRPARQDGQGDVRDQGRQDAAPAGADARVPAHLRRPLAGRAARADPRRAAAAAGVHAAAVGPRAGDGAHRRRRDVGAAAGPAACARPARRWPGASWRCRPTASPRRRSPSGSGCCSRTSCAAPSWPSRSISSSRRSPRPRRSTISEDDLNDEIDRLAEQSDESPRRVRARLEKEDLLDALAAEMIERKALDLILDSAEYEDAAADAGRRRRRCPPWKTRPCPARCSDLSTPPPAETETGRRSRRDAERRRLQPHPRPLQESSHDRIHPRPAGRPPEPALPRIHAAAAVPDQRHPAGKPHHLFRLRRRQLLRAGSSPT